MRALLILLLILALAVTGGVIYANTVWIPTHAKPQLEQLLSERTQLHVRMDHLQLRVPLGWVATDIRITDPAGRWPAFRIHHIQAQVAWGPLVREHRAAFRVFAQLDEPLPVRANIRGVYDWQAQTLTAQVRVPQLDIAALQPLWPSTLPVTLTHGTLRCDLDVNIAPEQPVQLRGNVAVHQLHATHTRSGYRAESNVTWDGQAAYDPQQHQWRGLEGTLTLHEGLLDAGRWGKIHDVQGTAQVSLDALNTIALRGQWLGTNPVEVRGTVRRRPAPAADLTMQARVNVTDQLYHLLPPIAMLLQPTGQLELTARWNGPWPTNDPVPLEQLPIALTAAVAEGQLLIPGASDAVTGIAGTGRYADDQLTLEDWQWRWGATTYGLQGRVEDVSGEPHAWLTLTAPELTSQLEALRAGDRVTIADWQTRYQHSHVRLRGDIDGRQRQASLYGDGALALADAARWPHIGPAITSWALRGELPVSFVVDGPLTAPHALQATMKWAETDLIARDLPVHLHGAEWQWQAQRLTLSSLRADLAGGQVALAGDVGVPVAEAPCRGSLLADRVALEPILRAVTPDQERYAGGLLVATADWSAEHCTQTALTGQGEFHISEGRLASVPFLDKVFWGLLGGLAERLGYAELRRAELTQASGRWTLAEGRVRSDDTLVVAQYAGSAIPIELRGWVGLDQQLDLTVEPQLPEDLLQHAPSVPQSIRELARVVVAVGDVKRLIGRQRITGTLKEPVSHFDVTLDELLKRGAVQGLQRLLFPSKTPAQ